MLTEQQLGNLIKNVTSRFTDKSVSMLHKQSIWDLESCKWFIWELKHGLKASLIAYSSVKYEHKLYLPDLSMLGITRFAPLGSRKQRKNLEKIIKQKGSFNLGNEYKDVASAYNKHLTMNTVKYLADNSPEMLMGLLDEKYFISTLENWSNLIFHKPDTNSDENDKEIWDPYLLQDFIVNDINEQNKKITEENNEKTDEKESLLIIPEDFDVIKDRAKISPL